MEYYLNQQLDIEIKTLESEEKPAMNTDLKKKKKKYTIYSEYNKMNFILHILTKAPRKIAPVARKYNINERTGQRWWNQYKNDPDKFVLPKARGDCKKLHEEHQAFLTDLLNANPSNNIEQALEQLTTKFEDSQVRKSAVHEFIRDDIGFTFKRAAFHSLKRNDEGAIEARYKWAKKIVETDKFF
jgi:transposase